MGTVIPFRSSKTGQLLDHLSDLTALLREAVTISNDPRYAKQNGIVTFAGEKIEDLFFGKITKELRETRRVALPYLYCARHAAHCCAQLLDHQPAYWTAFEYLAKAEAAQSADYLRQGGDTCLLLASLFPVYAERHMVNVHYYEAMGSGLYRAWHYQTGSVLGDHMADHFLEISSALKNAYRTL
ncbi:MAG: hypothetical protein A2408_00500 [Candidatus Yonathbacteria bacterium RIFOXYC1_FULL_52_10]|uniref:Uncharacterized protein n=1 Tax=Candidatus Yonathbacteria bacterium RIFOXYD1_FULL_52_36 TaxID=1802730 RepID=A0A1G2SJ55_9BACT|nr:MAG: hypothetical protein A2408_00500 [Candidatus Yonathbacteria bacterium RIFOXYC1_FULL_52_10]OHA85014.1 MAG: hypothetical protein A2591_02230 [Candidatus Yonathbacteria bacterium RIFOXYD1_FULL_52_36]